VREKKIIEDLLREEASVGFVAEGKSNKILGSQKIILE
jgi:hypothetical protein